MQTFFLLESWMISGDIWPKWTPITSNHVKIHEVRIQSRIMMPNYIIFPGGVLSEPLIRQKRQFPNPIESLTAKKIADTYVILSWETPPGVVDAYEVQHTASSPAPNPVSTNANVYLFQSCHYHGTASIHQLYFHWWDFNFRLRSTLHIRVESIDDCPKYPWTILWSCHLVFLNCVLVSSVQLFQLLVLISPRSQPSPSLFFRLFPHTRIRAREGRAFPCGQERTHCPHLLVVPRGTGWTRRYPGIHDSLSY